MSSLDYEINHKEKGDEWLFGKGRRSTSGVSDLQLQDKHVSGSLEPSMDLFSAGCVVYELLHESGKPPFSYGELCHYRRMSSSEAATFLERCVFDHEACLGALFYLPFGHYVDFFLEMSVIMSRSSIFRELP